MANTKKVVYVITNGPDVIGVYKNLARVDAELGEILKGIDNWKYSLYNLRKKFREGVKLVYLWEPRGTLTLTQQEIH